jgi:hypothetical protein
MVSEQVYFDCLLLAQLLSFTSCGVETSMDLLLTTVRLKQTTTAGCARFASPAGLMGLEGTDIAMLYALLASKPGTPVDAGTDDEGACSGVIG